MARKSRTVDPGGAPYRWEHHQDRFAGRVVENELEECLQTRCKTQSEYELMAAQVQARIERAEAGGLGVPGHPGPGPVVTQPSLWEIRWSFSESRELRSYHAEPTGEPTLLLGLKFHWKEFGGLSATEVEAAQNEQMSEAAARFRSSKYHGTLDG